MIVCLCHGVSDRTIKSLIAEGAGSVREVSRRCRAGTSCGACRVSIAELIAEAGPVPASQGSSSQLVSLPTSRAPLAPRHDVVDACAARRVG
jgi:bacterioferritin-associated ferredoxin